MSVYAYQITADSGCDLSLEKCAERGVMPYKMPFTMDGKPMTDGMTEESFREFYDLMRAGGIARTSQINPGEFTEFWRPLAEAGTPVLHISLAAAAFGTALNIVPIMHLDYEGHLEVWQKVRGDKQCFKKVIKDVQELVVDAAGQTLIVSEADAPEKAREYGEALVRECGFRDVFYTHIGPIIGAHTGPGLISIFFVGKERA